MAKEASKFKLSVGNKPTSNTDDVGRVGVVVRLSGKTGNIIRSLTLTDCKVSEVFEAIKAALVE